MANPHLIDSAPCGFIIYSRTIIKAGHHAGEAGKLAQTHASTGATAIRADHLPDAFFRLCRGHHIWPDNWLADILGRHMITAFRPDIFGQIILI